MRNAADRRHLIGGFADVHALFGRFPREVQCLQRLKDVCAASAHFQSCWRLCSADPPHR